MAKKTPLNIECVLARMVACLPFSANISVFWFAHVIVFGNKYQPVVQQTNLKHNFYYFGFFFSFFKDFKSLLTFHHGTFLQNANKDVKCGNKNDSPFCEVCYVVCLFFYIFKNTVQPTDTKGLDEVFTIRHSCFLICRAKRLSWAALSFKQNVLFVSVN